MKYAKLVLLCVFASLIACDKSEDSTSAQMSAARESNAEEEKSSLASDAASLMRDAGDKAAEELDNALESAKDAADKLAASAKETAGAAKDAAVEFKGSAIESAGVAVEQVKEVSSEAVQKSSDVIASVTDSDAQRGESVYQRNCMACHGAGVAGAPKLGDRTAWETRIAQGDEVLVQHAIEGFKGSTGYMPPKGGYMNLGDEEVSLAVRYMVSQVK